MLEAGLGQSAVEFQPGGVVGQAAVAQAQSQAVKPRFSAMAVKA